MKIKLVSKDGALDTQSFEPLLNCVLSIELNAEALTDSMLKAPDETALQIGKAVLKAIADGVSPIPA